MRFDPGFVYTSKQTLDQISHFWIKNKIKRVEILLNNPNFGAFFDTHVPGQPQEQGLGRTQEMKSLIQKLKRHHIEVYAWVYPLRSKSAWTSHPEWRAPSCEQAKNEFLLDVKVPAVRAWYSAVIQETVSNYPALNGVDFAEPISSLGCAPSERARTEALTAWLKSEVVHIQRAHKKVSLTPTITALPSGKLWPYQKIRDQFGTDLPAIFKSAHWDEVYPQLNYREWLDRYQLPKVFHSQWPKKAFLEFKTGLKHEHVHLQKIGIHLEFGDIKMDSLYQMLKGFNLVDLYDTHLAIQKKFNAQKI